MRLFAGLFSRPPHYKELRGLPVRDAERWLRDNGHSRKAAKRCLSQHKRRLDLVQ